MRPIRLELSGFTAFREQTDVDFDGAELFAFTGPTGAGKTSLIDALCFALYGAVPRYDDRRLVAPVISQGKLEARVRLDFAVGANTYTVARVVRRAGSGASTKEARLQSGGQVFAGDAKTVTEQVQRLLGLRFEQFITCVVLPQGEFARFLHETPAGRQDLLVQLLDLGMYRQLAQAANQRATEAELQLAIADAELSRVAEVTPAARAAAARRAAELEGLRADMDAAKPRIDALDEAIGQARGRQAQATRAAELLARLAVPAGTPDLARRVRAAAEAVGAAERAHADAEHAAADAQRARADLGDPSLLRDAVRAHADRAALADEQTRAERQLGVAGKALDLGRRRLDRATQDYELSRQALEEVRAAHAADHLVARLRPGQPCPVCEQPVARVPERMPAAPLADAQARLDEAAAEQREAQQALADAQSDHAVQRARLEQVRQRLRDLEVRLAQGPELDAARAGLEAIAAADRRVGQAAEALARARRRLAQARSDDTELRAVASAAWAAFDAARDAVAGLGPPPVDRDDVGAAWEAIDAWAASQVPLRRQEAADARAQADDADRGRRLQVEGFRRRCTDLGVRVEGSPRDACVEALTEARAQVRSLDAELARADALRAERVEQSRRRQVARSLGTHLGARGFEGWLLDEALAALLAGASETLRELSSGQYSLAVDDHRAFTVVDHRNADEQRSARTLSGGETFLASLSLALALADQVADLAAHGAPKLEAIFLDEGFGTLDADTLDVVAAAIEELGARGRTVGLVTHVRDLAERLPVRFEVRRTPATATVHKVQA